MEVEYHDVAKRYPTVQCHICGRIGKGTQLGRYCPNCNSITYDPLKIDNASETSELKK